MKKFFKNLAMACLAALSCVAIGLGTGCEAVNSVLGTFESLGGHIGNVIDKSYAEIFLPAIFCADIAGHDNERMRKINGFSLSVP